MRHSAITKYIETYLQKCGCQVSAQLFLLADSPYYKLIVFVRGTSLQYECVLTRADVNPGYVNSTVTRVCQFMLTCIKQQKQGNYTGINSPLWKVLHV